VLRLTPQLLLYKNGMHRLPGGNLAVSVDDGEWDQVGAELRRVDPVRWLEILELAKRIVEAHVDPAADLMRRSVDGAPRAKGSA